MLFLDTLEVKAYDNTVTPTLTVTGTVYPDSLVITKETGSVTGSTSTYSSVVMAEAGSTGTYNVHFQDLYAGFVDFGLVSNFDSNLKYCSISTWNNLVSCSYGSFILENVSFGAPISQGGNNSVGYTYFYKNNFRRFVSGSAHYCVPLFVSGYWSYEFTSTNTNIVSGLGVNFNFSGTYYMSDATDETVSSSGQQVIDLGTKQAIEDQTEIVEDTNTTTHSIFDKISDFFGSFFNNLIGVFVPESGYFSNWFSRVNDLLADKLGILYFPFDFIIDTLTTINSNSSSSSGQIIFPEMSFTNSATSETFVLLNRQVINLNDYDVPFTSSENSSLVGTTNFTSLLSIIRLFTGIAFTLALVHLFIDKLHLILRGSERG